MPTVQQVIERMTTAPAFQGRFGLFAVSEEAWPELRDAGLPADPRLTERGYMSVVINGVPVIYNDDVTGSHVIAIDRELIEILAR